MSAASSGSGTSSNSGSNDDLRKDYDKLKKDMAKLRDDFTSLMGDAVERGKEGAAAGREAMETKVNEAGEWVACHAKERPFTTIAVAAVGGYLLGKLILRR